MREKPAVVTANLGPKVAAFTTHIDGRPTAVINAAAARNHELRHQATCALLGVGLDAGLILGALYGIRR